VAAFDPDFTELPEEIAVFPLPGALLLPHGRLPLNIFEPRYLAMTFDSLANGRMFGMVQPEPGRPRGSHGPVLYRTGCLGRLSSFAETEDGRLLITLSGVIRFRISEELEMRPDTVGCGPNTTTSATTWCRWRRPRGLTARRCSRRCAASSRRAGSRRIGRRWSRPRTPSWC